MADNRLKYVRLSLAEISARSAFILDQVDRVENEIPNFGDTMQFPAVASLTCVDDGNVSTTPSAPTDDLVSLQITNHPACFVDLPAVASTQNIGGGWAEAIAGQALRAIRNKMDADFLMDCTKAQTFSTDGSYVSNAAAATLTKAHFAEAYARLADQDGSDPQNFMWVLDAWAHSALQNLAEFHPNGSSDISSMGVPVVGHLFGAPVFMAGRSVARDITATSSSVVVSGGSALCTLPSGHGFQVGSKISTSGLTTDDTDVIVSAVTATSISYPTSGSGTYADGVGTITCSGTRNLLIDKSYTHAAIQKVPSTRVIPINGRTADELQCSAIWGSAGRVGRAVTLMGPTGAL